ncbi:hypothetical protein [Lysobacter sp. HA18]
MASRFLSKAALALAFSCAMSAHAEQWTLCTALSHDGNPAVGVVTVSQVFPVSAAGDYLTEWRTYIAQKYLGMSEHIALCSESVDSAAQAATGRDNFIYKYSGAYVVDEPDWRPRGAMAAPTPAQNAATRRGDTNVAQPATNDASDTASSDDDDAQAARAQEEAQARERTRRDAEAKAKVADAAKVEQQRKADAAAKATRDAEAKRREQTEKLKASTDTDANRCVTTPEVKTDATFKGNTAASVMNGCGVPVDVRVCLMTDGGWNCGMTYGLQPQQRWSYSSFKATGRVFMDARTSTSSRKMASPD